MSLKSIFPDQHLAVTSGIIEESGTSIIDGAESKGPQRWVRVNGKLITRLEDGLYHSQKNDKVKIVHDTQFHAVAFRNETSGSGSSPSYSAIFGVLALMVILSAALYLGGVWNYIWKSGWNWWFTVLAIFLYSLYAIVWTFIYAYREWKRQAKAHQMISSPSK
ncbi:MAG: hypothetical protein IT223_08335 [Crocinitomicaceae bacterium]|nr:hypothetical protein [Crocinitomicaceae bacterium]